MMRELARFPRLRALTWSGNVLYASRGYELLRARLTDAAAAVNITWERAAVYEAPAWRKFTSGINLASRFARDGFHALAHHPSGALVGAVPGAIVTCPPNEHSFRLTHKITRGTRPLNICATPEGKLFWGEYFDNASRDEVHIYGSSNRGHTWQIAHTFPNGSIRHIHNIVYDRWRECLWILTGDYGDECRILKAALDLSRLETIVSGNQQARAAAFVPARDALYFATDTPLEKNFICRLGENGTVTRLTEITSSSIYGCRTRDAIYFSTMIEPSEVNSDQHVRLYQSREGHVWSAELYWKKDAWPVKWFQYGNAFLPSGENATDVLAVSTLCVEGDDAMMFLYGSE